MNIPLTSTDVTDIRTPDRQLIDGLQQTLHANYGRLLEAAKEEWENKFAGNDPSDACVTVRITTAAPAPRQLACAGILEKPKTRSLNGRHWGVPA
ncbi:MAG: hypothetical protein ABJB22_00720 [Verrucomicrobiota bacterium]